MTYDEISDKYFARPSGAVGYEILEPGRGIVAWAADGWWAATIVELLNERAVAVPRRPRAGIGRGNGHE